MFATLKKALNLEKRTFAVEQAARALPNAAIVADAFEARRIFHHGLPPLVSCLAYDPVQKLLAVGTEAGAVKVLGQPGIEMSLLPDMFPEPIGALEFVKGEGYLIGLHGPHSIVGWSMEDPTAAPRSWMDENERFTTLYAPTDSKWVYVGTESGRVIVFDIEKWGPSAYQIDFEMLAPAIADCPPSAVTVITHVPGEDGMLLIATSSRVLLQWELAKKKVAKRWMSQMVEGITCATWHREGKFFLTGHNDGRVCVWDVKQASKPARVFYVSPTPPTTSLAPKRTPISEMTLITPKTGAATLYVAGGTVKDEEEGISVFPNWEKDIVVLCPVSGGVRDMLLAVKSPWALEPESPPVVAAISNDGELLTWAVMSSQPDWHIALPLPSFLATQAAPITFMKSFSECPLQFMSDLYQQGRRQGAARVDHLWPFSGGQFGEAPRATSEFGTLTITGHADGAVRFWDANTLNVTLLYTISVSHLGFGTVNNMTVIAADLEVHARELVVCVLSGESIVLRFFATPSAPELVRIGDIAQANSSPVPQPRSGFMPLALICHATSPVLVALLVPAWNRLILVDVNARLNVYDTEAWLHLVRNVQFPVDDPPICICATEAFHAAGQEVKDGVVYPAAPCLLVGFTSGCVQSFNLLHMTADTVQPKNISPCVKVYGLDATGHVIHNMVREWVDAPILPASPATPAAAAPPEPATPEAVMVTAPTPVAASEAPQRSATSADFPSTAPTPSSSVQTSNFPGTPVNTPVGRSALAGAAAADEVSASTTQQRVVCDHDEEETATVRCAECDANFCTPCDEVLHKPASKKTHVRTPLEAAAPAPTQRSAPTPAAAAGTPVQSSPLASPAAAPAPAPAATVGTPAKQSPLASPVTAPVAGVPVAGAPVAKQAPAAAPVAQEISPVAQSSMILASKFAATSEGDPRYILVVGARRLRLYKQPLRDPNVAKHSIEDDQPAIINCAVSELNAESGPVLVTFDRAGHVAVYTLLQLTALYSCKLEFGAVCNVSSLVQSQILPDGRMIIVSRHNELIFMSLYKDENAMYVPFSYPRLHVPGIALPPRPSGGFLKGLFGSGPTDTEALFGTQAAQARSTGGGAGAGAAAAGAGAAAGGAAAARTAQANSDIAQTRNVMSENMQRLNERGEKLDQLSTRTAEMENNAADFLKNIREFNERQARKKWYEL